MPVTETVMGLGSWNFTLIEETPKTVLDQLQYFGHMAFVPGRLNPAEYGDQLLDMARYVGVLTGRDFDHIRKVVDGQSTAIWLGDADGKGDVIEAPGLSINDTFPNAIRAVLGSGTAVVEGTLHSVPGTYKGRHVWQDKRKAVDYICTVMGAEWRVTGACKLDAGLAEDLYSAAPDTVIVRRRPNRHTDGDDLTMHGLRGDMGVATDVDDWTTRLVLLAEGQGDAVVTGVADNPANPYLDVRGQPVKRTRIISESETTTTNAQGRAEYQLSRFVEPRAAMRMTTDDYDVVGAFAVGDWAYVYDPDTGLVDPGVEITFRGERINPIRLRMMGASWPIRQGMTVAYRTQDGSWLDLTPYVDWEGGETTIDVGDMLRALSDASVEPVGPRPIPDSTVPGVVEWSLPFESGVYLGADGSTQARMLVKWDLPLNVDGSTILDGDHYEIAYGVSPVTGEEWQIAYAPWGDLQAMINGLTPGTDYDFRIRAVDSSNNAGAWSVTQTEQTEADTIPPSTPAPPTVAGNLLSIQIVHELGKSSGGTFNLELDLDHLEVHVGASTSYTPDDTTLRGKIPANAGMIQAEIPAVGTVPAAETTTRYIKVIAVDQAGNRSNPSTAATVTAQLIDDAHITSVTVDKVTAGTLAANIILGASIRTASTGQRVELNTSGLQMFNSAGTQLVSIAPGSTFYLRSGTSGARLDLSTVTGLQIYNSAGTRTAQLDVDGSFELRTAATGARVVLDGSGLAAYNSSGSQTVDIDAATGSATVVGQLATGFSGSRRVVIDPATNDIKFYGGTGGTSARIVEYGNANNYSALNLETSVSSSGSGRQGIAILHPDFVTVQLFDPNALNGVNGRINITPTEFSLLGTYGGSSQELRCNSSGWRLNGNTIKSFIIPHPDDPDRWLIHGCTESPNNGVEYWGDVLLDELGAAEVVLPSYFESLTHTDGRAVMLTGCGDQIAPPTASYPRHGRFDVWGAPGQRVFWLVKAIRKDVPPVLVEPLRDDVIVTGTAPYLSYTVKDAA